jgi:hypothetical protein
MLGYPLTDGHDLLGICLIDTKYSHPRRYFSVVVHRLMLS